MATRKERTDPAERSALVAIACRVVSLDRLCGEMGATQHPERVAAALEPLTDAERAHVEDVTSGNYWRRRLSPPIRETETPL
jgi:hypothetical protein